MDSNALDVLVNVLSYTRICRYCTLSATVLLFYEYIIALPDEVALVWRSPRSSVKMIFILNRYFALLFVVTYTSLMFIATSTSAPCAAAFDLQAWAFWFGCALVEGLLQFWVCSVYQPSKRIRYLMSGIYVALAVSSGVALSLVLRKVKADIEMPGCTLESSHDTAEILTALAQATQPHESPAMFACILPSVVYELVLLAFLVRKAIHFARTDGPSKMRNNPVATVLIRDSVLYFIIILIAYLANAIIWTFAPAQLFQTGVGFGVALPSLLGSRLLLDLRGAHQRIEDRFAPAVALSHTTRWDRLDFSEVSSISTMGEKEDMEDMEDREEIEEIGYFKGASRLSGLPASYV